MIVADSCVWIERAVGSATGARYAWIWDRPEELITPTLVQFEFNRWALRELDPDKARLLIASTQLSRVVELSETAALHGAHLSRLHGLAAMDALIYATALHHGATLVTCDAHFEGLPQVDYTPKLPV